MSRDNKLGVDKRVYLSYFNDEKNLSFSPSVITLQHSDIVETLQLYSYS